MRQRRVPKRHRPVVLPTSELGSGAVALAVASVVLLTSWSLLGRLGGFPGLLLGLAAGPTALVAIIRRGERAIAVFAALLPFLTVVAFVLAELLLGHG